MKIDLRNVPDAEVSGIDLANVDITVPAPETEPQRQYYFMDIAKNYVEQLAAKKGSPLTFHVTTFGCQMNTENEIVKAAFKRLFSLG